VIGVWLSTLTRHRLIWAVAVLLSAASAWPHDFWIEPTSFTPQAGQRIGVRLRVGENFMGEPVAYNPALIAQFFAEDDAGRQQIVGTRSVDVAGQLAVKRPGMQVIGYRSKPSAITLAAEKFNRYLQEEGLDSVIAIRAQRKQTDAEASEHYSRSAKSILCAEPADENQADRYLGFTLELVAEQNLCVHNVDQTIPFRLLYQTHPLADALVVAINQQHPSDKQSARTDSEGRVRFRLQSGGVWLIKAVHMVDATAETHAEWESFWASLTFERRPH